MPMPQGPQPEDYVVLTKGDDVRIMQITYTGELQYVEDAPDRSAGEERAKVLAAGNQSDAWLQVIENTYQLISD